MCVENFEFCLFVMFLFLPKIVILLSVWALFSRLNGLPDLFSMQINVEKNKHECDKIVTKVSGSDHYAFEITSDLDTNILSITCEYTQIFIWGFL